MLNITQYYRGRVYQGAYATGPTLNRIGVIPESELTLETTAAKLNYLISLGDDANSIRKLMTTPLCGKCSIS